MTFTLAFQQTEGQNTSIQMEPGDVLFVLGANGTGKSSLMQKFY